MIPLSEKEKKEKLIDLIALSKIAGIGPNRMYSLIERFGTAGAVLSHTVADLTDIPGIGSTLAGNIVRDHNRKEAAEAAERIIKMGWRIIMFDDPLYPPPLANVVDKPPFLFYMGEYLEADRNAIAIVGSRLASDEGHLFAEQLAAALAEHGVTVVSGMARGIDTAAHRGALDAGGRTIAVFGSSLDRIYPPEGKDMATQILNSGAIFSEFLPETPPLGDNFPRRNRIISGLSEGVVIIEAAERSGALSTAAHALAQNREVFAVPGSPRRRHSRGTNELIKQGATLLTSAEDIFTQLPRLGQKTRKVQLQHAADLTDVERDILQYFSEGPIHIDNLTREMNAPVSDLLQILLALELKGVVRELSGKRYILN
ncbi:MAG: DNA-processing protein DprA [Candidatus Zixiibacteriota bacterium]|nr:MAG: DNA-processing protein DprA [candidate division Zixibacteria bacterium]